MNSPEAEDIQHQNPRVAKRTQHLEAALEEKRFRLMYHGLIVERHGPGSCG